MHCALYTVIPTKRSAWRDLLIIILNSEFPRFQLAPSSERVRGARMRGRPQCVFLAIDEPWRCQSLERLHEGEPLTTASGGSLVRGEVTRKGVLTRAVRESRDYGSAVSARILTPLCGVTTIEVAGEPLTSLGEVRA